jgi:hypothetical protein
MSSCGLSLEHDPEKEFPFSRRIMRQDKIESMTMSHIVSSRSGGQPGRRSRRRRLRFLRERILNIAADSADHRELLRMERNEISFSVGMKFN